MRKTILLLLLLLSTIFAWAKHKPAKKSNSNKIISAELYHSPCYGRCPVYKVAVNNEGIATFTGIRFIQDSGIFQKHIGKKEAEQILTRISIAMADTFQDVYRSRAEDLPGTTLTIKYANKVKTIRNSNLGPMNLQELGALVDGIASGKIDASWQRVNAAVK